MWITEPYVYKAGDFVMTAAVPIYADDNHTVNGVLAAVIPAQWLTEQIKDIVVGDTGYCFIIGNTGTNIGHKDFTLVSEQNNSLEKVKTDKSLVSNAAFLQRALDEMSARLTEAMREQENGSREVLTAIKSINTVTVEVQSGSEEMLKGGEGVAKEMQKLDSLTRIITDSMNEMASGAVQINNAVQEVSEITQKNKGAIENLAAEVGKFKV